VVCGFDSRWSCRLWFEGNPFGLSLGQSLVSVCHVLDRMHSTSRSYRVSNVGVCHAHMCINRYAQNLVTNMWSSSPKLFNIPIGLGLHDGFIGSPNEQATMDTMTAIRGAAAPFLQRARTVLYDQGTFTVGGHQRRDRFRADAARHLLRCPLPHGRIDLMPHSNRTDCWNAFSAHQFGVAPTGMGWDTHRLWELLFFGTVPIVLSGPLDRLLIEARLPVVIVQSWQEVCKWTDSDYALLEDRYAPWIAKIDEWLEPRLWVPRDQRRMEELCDLAGGCRQAPWNAPSRWLPGVH
jgi:hypothetical protein